MAKPTKDKLVRECGVGLVEITVEGDGPERLLTLSLPPATVTSLTDDEIAEVEEILGHVVDRDATPAIIDVGAAWIIAQLSCVDVVLRLRPDLAPAVIGSAADQTRSADEFGIDLRHGWTSALAISGIGAAKSDRFGGSFRCVLVSLPFGLRV